MSETKLTKDATKTAIAQLLLSEWGRLEMRVYALAKAAGLGRRTVKDIVVGPSDPQAFGRYAAVLAG